MRESLEPLLFLGMAGFADGTETILNALLEETAEYKVWMRPVGKKDFFYRGKAKIVSHIRAKGGEKWASCRRKPPRLFVQLEFL